MVARSSMRCRGCGVEAILVMSILISPIAAPVSKGLLLSSTKPPREHRLVVIGRIPTDCCILNQKESRRPGSPSFGAPGANELSVGRLPRLVGEKDGRHHSRLGVGWGSKGRVEPATGALRGRRLRAARAEERPGQGRRATGPGRVIPRGEVEGRKAIFRMRGGRGGLAGCRAGCSRGRSAGSRRELEKM